MRPDSNISNRRFFAIAVPIIFANITIPMIGLVDTAVIGHLGSAVLIAGAGMGAAFLTGVYHLFNFLTTGVSAFTSQARGKSDQIEVLANGFRGMLMGLVLGFCIFIVHKPLFNFIFFISPAEDLVNDLAHTYISIRVFAAPFALANFAFMGWLLAVEKSFTVTLIQSSVTLMNIILDLFFVIHLELGVPGVAMASAISEAFGFSVSLFFCRKIFTKKLLSERKFIFNLSKWLKILGANTDIFLRTLLLECVAISYIVIGSTLGTLTQATNQILYQFLSFSSYALDGFAFSSQVLVGISYGRKSLSDFRKVFLMGLKWGLAGGGFLTVVFLIFGEHFVDLMTVAEDVREEAYHFLFFMAITPLTGVSSWILDGVFVGALETKKMRRAMLESVIFYGIVAAITVPTFGNYGLWLSVSGLFICRAVTLLVRYRSLETSLGKL